MEHDVIIRLAHADEIRVLPSMQVAAGALFRRRDMAPVADGPTPGISGFVHAHQAGRLIVAVDEAERVIGFVRLELLDDAIHVEQVTVAPGQGGQGIGGRLMLAAEELARRQGFSRMTLTAFRDVPFNGPFYTSLGWQVLPDAQLTPGLAAIRLEEAQAGLDAWPRQAMIKHV